MGHWMIFSTYYLEGPTWLRRFPLSLAQNAACAVEAGPLVSATVEATAIPATVGLRPSCGRPASGSRRSYAEEYNLIRLEVERDLYERVIENFAPESLAPVK